MKYAPPRADGLKPWVVTIFEWGRGPRQRIVYAESRRLAEHKAKDPMLFVTAKARRATPQDMEAVAL